MLFGKLFSDYRTFRQELLRPGRKIYLSITDNLRAPGIRTQFVTPFKGLESAIPLSSLDSITLNSFRKFFSGMRGYIKVYQGLAAGPQLEKPV